MRKIYVVDYTLPAMTKDREFPLLAREKYALSRRLVRLGVDEIVLPAIINPKEDIIILKTIAAGVGETVLSVPAGDTIESVDLAWDGVKEAAKPALRIVLPVSTVQMEYRYHLKEAKMAEKIAALVSHARSKGCAVYFEAQDAMRASEDFLIAALTAAVNAGAERVTLCDDGGNILPEFLTERIEAVKKVVSVPVIISLSDGIHCACANALTALRAGADGVTCAVTGKDVLHTGDFAAAFAALGENLGLSSGLLETEIFSDINAMLKSTREPSASSGDGTGSASVFLDGDSTPGQVEEAARSLGYDLSADDVGKVHESLMRICEKKSNIGAKELEAIIASVAMQAPSTYHLVRYQAASSNLANAMTSVTLSRGDDQFCGVATGDGPIDSSFKAIEQSIGHHYELDDFQIQAVTEGKEALGSALVRLRSEGKLYSGNGISADIVGASIRAYLNALNKIVYEETEQ